MAALVRSTRAIWVIVALLAFVGGWPLLSWLPADDDVEHGVHVITDVDSSVARVPRSFDNP